MAKSFDLMEEATRLIQFNTVTNLSNAECAVYVGGLFRRAGLDVAYQDSKSDSVLFMNVIGSIGKGKRPILLTTHMDTVDPGDPRLWTKTNGNPWKMTVRGHSLYGLGVADTKLDLLCKLSAIVSLKLSDLKQRILLAGTFGEESGLRGAARLCQGDFPKPQMALVGEPSELAIVTRHKGLAVGEILFKRRGLYRPSSPQWVYEITFLGEAAHSSTPDLGRNALLESVRFLKSLKKKYRKINLLFWEGGTAHNILPAKAVVRFSLGEHPRVNCAPGRNRHIKITRIQPGWYSTLPFENLLWIVGAIEEIFSVYEKEKDRAFTPSVLTWNITLLKEMKEGWSLVFDVRPLPGQTIHRAIKNVESALVDRLGHPGSEWQFHLERDNPPLDTGSSSFLQDAKRALRAAHLSAKCEVKSGCSEAGLYSKVGIPSMVFGPGRSTGNIHRPNETISTAQLKGAIRFYKEFLAQTCF